MIQLVVHLSYDLAGNSPLSADSCGETADFAIIVVQVSGVET